MLLLLPQRYVFSSKSQRNVVSDDLSLVVVATTKVRIFKQITTPTREVNFQSTLLLLPQRYVFSSKSQLVPQRRATSPRCCCYHKGTYFQANHNCLLTCQSRLALLLLPQRYVFSSKSQHFMRYLFFLLVVVATTKVRIFKQITTGANQNRLLNCCCCYHKGTYFQANHNTVKYIYNTM